MWTVSSLLAVITRLSYTAVFDGDTTFTGSSGTGRARRLTHG
jgi:hypothetical protein